MRVLTLYLLGACTGPTPGSTPSETPTPGEDISFFGAESEGIGKTGVRMVSATRSDGERVLLVLTRTFGIPWEDDTYARVDRFDPTPSGYEGTLLGETGEQDFSDLGVLDALELGHDQPVIFALGKAWNLDDGSEVPYDVHPMSTGAPVPCGDVDGDGLPDRCHSGVVRFANGDSAVVATGVSGYTAGPPSAITTVRACSLQDVAPREYTLDDFDCSRPGPQFNSVRERDVDGDGLDDFIVGDLLTNWNGDTLARLPAAGPGDFADLDGDGVLDLAQKRVPDADHERQWLAFYRGPLQGDLTPDGEWTDPCHVEPYSTTSFANHREFVDLDRDGVLDVVVTHEFCHSGRVFVNTDPFGP